MRESTKTHFLSDEQCSCIIHGHGHCDIGLPKDDQERVLAKGKARPHRWAPEKGYVTSTVNDEENLEPAMDLIRMSRRHFADLQNVPQTEDQEN